MHGSLLPAKFLWAKNNAKKKANGFSARVRYHTTIMCPSFCLTHDLRAHFLLIFHIFFRHTRDNLLEFFLLVLLPLARFPFCLSIFSASSANRIRIYSKV